MPTSAWNLPNMALVEVLLPDSATPMKPSSGATTMKADAELGEGAGQRAGHARIVEDISQAEDEDADQAGAPHLRPGLGENLAELRSR